MISEFFGSHRVAVYSAAGIIGFIVAYYLIKSIRRAEKERSSFNKAYDKILNSDEHKVKGRFEA
jgi:hypothetical protein